MTAGEVAQIITALTAFGAMALSWVVALRVNKVVAKVDEVHFATNGLQEKLLEATAAASRAEGVKAALAEKAGRNG